MTSHQSDTTTERKPTTTSEHKPTTIEHKSETPTAESELAVEPRSGTTTGPLRRDLMKVVGAGAALGIFGGVATADEHDEEADDDEESDDETDTDEEPVTDGTVHTVYTLVSESTNPGRPADFFFQPTGLHIDPGDVIKFVFATPDHTVTSYHPAFGMERRIPSGVQPFSSPVLGWDPTSLPDDIDMPPEIAEEPEADMEDAVDAMDPDDEEPDDDQDDEDSDDAEESVDSPRPAVWLYAFETPGVYDIECAPHEAYGMSMRVVVGDETETSFETADQSELPEPRVGPVGLSRTVLTDANLEPDAIVSEGRVEWYDLEANQELDDDDDELDDDDDELDDDDDDELDDDVDDDDELDDDDDDELDDDDDELDDDDDDELDDDDDDDELDDELDDDDDELDDDDDELDDDDD